MSVAVLVPWRSDGGPRQTVWAWVRAQWARWPDWEIVTGAPPDGPWSKGAAVADALRQTRADVLVVADADVWSDGIPAAVNTVASGRARWAMPHQLVRRLTETATRAVLAGAPLEGQPTTETHPGMPGGGIVVLARDVLTGVPMDPHFEGWGQEDQSWALALTTLAGPMWRGTADLHHLWHPPAPRRSRAVGSAASLARYRRYQAASGQVSQMRALLAEFCPTPMEGFPMTYRYRNANTGDEVEYPQPNARLEMLPNWSRIPVAETPPEPADEPEQPDEQPAQAAVGRPPADEPEQPDEQPAQAAVGRPPADEPEQPDEQPAQAAVGRPPADEPEQPDEQPAQAAVGRPPASEPKAAWVEYATSRAKDSGEAAEIATLTKAELIDRYGSKEN